MRLNSASDNTISFVPRHQIPVAAAPVPCCSRCLSRSVTAARRSRRTLQPVNRCRATSPSCRRQSLCRHTAAIGDAAELRTGEWRRQRRCRPPTPHRHDATVFSPRELRTRTTMTTVDASKSRFCSFRRVRKSMTARSCAQVHYRGRREGIGYTRDVIPTLDLLHAENLNPVFLAAANEVSTARRPRLRSRAKTQRCSSTASCIGSSEFLHS